jgi:CheY-like chemotaxis protein
MCYPEGASQRVTVNHQPILVIDDDPSFRSAVAEILRSEGYLVETAANGLEGLTAIREVRYALIVLDLRMPTIDGSRFARMLEASDIHVPILVITSARNPQKWAKEIGAAGYLAKPLDIPEFVETVDEIISHHNLPDIPAWQQRLCGARAKQSGGALSVVLTS